MKNKRLIILTTLIIAAMVFVPGISIALPTDSEVAGGVFEGTDISWSLSDEGVLTIRGTGDISDFEPPWEEYNNEILRVDIGSGITGIGHGTFSGCGNLLEVVIPDTVKKIGPAAFSRCSSLTEIEIPDSVEEIGSSTFWQCYNLSSVKLPVGLKCLPECVFYYCSNLQSITLPQGLEVIESNAFNYCGLQEIHIPAGVKTIQEGAFTNCAYIRNIAVDEGNTEFVSRDGVLFNKDMTVLVQYPAGKQEKWVETPEGQARVYEIPEGVTSVQQWAFSRCYYLDSVTIPQSMTNVQGFNACKSLRFITIPESVSIIGEAAFYGCSNLQKVVIEDGTERIEINAFNSCKALREITLPQTLLYLGGGSFNNCSTLENITIPPNVIEIDEFALAQCYELREIHLPAALAEIKSDSLNECTSINRITVDENNVHYCSEDGVLFNKDKTKLVTYPAGKDDLAYTVPKGVESVGQEAFSYNGYIQRVILPSSVAEIERWGFIECSSLETVVLTDHLQKIGFRVFINTSINDVYYGGTQEEWDAISIEPSGSDDPLPAATVHFGTYDEGSLYNEELGKTVQWRYGSDNRFYIDGDVSADYPVSVASYDEDGRLESIGILDHPGSTEAVGGKNVKIFWMSGNGSLPVCDCGAVDLVE